MKYTALCNPIVVLFHLKWNLALSLAMHYLVFFAHCSFCLLLFTALSCEVSLYDNDIDCSRMFAKQPLKVVILSPFFGSYDSHSAFILRNVSASCQQNILSGALNATMCTGKKDPPPGRMVGGMKQ